MIRRIVSSLTPWMAAFALLTPTALAVGTERFEIETQPTFLTGTLDGVSVHSNGHVTPSLALRRTPLDAALTAYTAVRGRDGALYVGTGTDGVIYRLRGDTVDRFAETHQLLVASMVFDEAGTLYAGTLPEGRIFAVQPNGQTREVVKLENAEHVWALIWDRRGNRLVAATGPDGRIYGITPANGRTELLYDGPDVHVMSLALTDDGTLYAGTSDRALVLRIEGGTTTVVYDAPGNEITALAVQGTTLYVAANEFQPIAPQAAPTTPRTAPPIGRTRPRPGKGRLFRIDASGRVEKIFEEADGHFTDLETTADGSIYAACGKDGRIFRVAPDRTSSVYVDVDERQVLSLGLTAQEPYFVTGDGAAVYRLQPRPTAQPSWTSAVLDAQMRADFGQLVLRGAGAIEFATRTGNVDPPDATWSEWSRFQAGGARVASPAARFLQIKVRFPATGASELRGISTYYLPQNQRPVVTGVSVQLDANQATQRRRGRLAPTSVVRLTWRVENPDADELRYRLRVRREGDTQARDLLRSDVVHTATTYDWETQGLADGLYVVEVEVTDELSNPEARILRSSASSDPIVVDNHAPRIDGLTVRGDAIVGRAIDTVGPVTRLEMAVDGQPYRDVDAEDGLLDTADEGIRIPVSAAGAGRHVVSVRATDLTGHQAVAEVTVGR